MAGIFAAINKELVARIERINEMTLATLLEILQPLCIFILAQLAWFLICMIIKGFDMVFSAILLKPQSNQIGYSYMIGSVVITVISAYNMIKL